MFIIIIIIISIIYTALMCHVRSPGDPVHPKKRVEQENSEN